MKTGEAQSRRSVQRIINCVRSRDGWCALKNQRQTTYCDSMETRCGMFVMLPWGMERRKPDCEECRKEANNKTATSGDKKNLLPIAWEA